MKVAAIDRLLALLEDERAELLRHRAVLTAEETRVERQMAELERRRLQAAEGLQATEHEQYAAYCICLEQRRGALLGQLRHLQEADLAVGQRLLDLHLRGRAYGVLRERTMAIMRRRRERRERVMIDETAVRRWLEEDHS